MTASSEFEALLVAGASRALVVAALWATAVALAALVEQASGGRLRILRRVGCPAAWRPAVLLTASALLSVLGAGGAGAATGPLPVPERPSGAPARVIAPAATPAAAQAAAQAPSSGTVVVRPGDTLWALARDRLPDRAGDADVLALVARTHAANRAVVGADPDLLHPGQRLRLPPIPPGARR